MFCSTFSYEWKCWYSLSQPVPISTAGFGCRWPSKEKWPPGFSLSLCRESFRLKKSPATFRVSQYALTQMALYRDSGTSHTVQDTLTDYDSEFSLHVRETRRVASRDLVFHDAVKKWTEDRSMHDGEGAAKGQVCIYLHPSYVFLSLRTQLGMMMYDAQVPCFSFSLLSSPVAKQWQNWNPIPAASVVAYLLSQHLKRTDMKSPWGSAANNAELQWQDWGGGDGLWLNWGCWCVVVGSITVSIRQPSQTEHGVTLEDQAWVRRHSVTVNYFCSPVGFDPGQHSDRWPTAPARPCSRISHQHHTQARV